ncbi:BTB/POZ and TAZ domain-containing protein 4-like [Impatiens glandulifera]|uniref:BTB/POZ and TAZ domain-containing protein 4-like n=1 Tax=Impatiens glandulifera TaxID=253017 RepID=UPI001FB17285|nr:BTB/POZ and TAZ domain-containing protein 4-like [Impatiens glandulifera]
MADTSRPIPLPPSSVPKLCSFINNRSNLQSVQTRGLLDRMFDEAYRADVSIQTDNDGLILAHASVLGMSSPVLKAMLKNTKPNDRRHHRSISIRGVPHEAVRVFVRFLYSSWQEPSEIKENALPLLVLSHKYAVPELKRVCERQLEIGRMLTMENVIDILQLALLCDAPRLSLICHRFVAQNLKAVSVTDGWMVMKESHPILENQLKQSIRHEELKQNEKKRRIDERKVYAELYEAMEALVHICREGRLRTTIGSHDKKDLKNDQQPSGHVSSCKVLELLVRHFAGCKLRVGGGCIRCKKMWQLLELHSHLCAESNACVVPLCRNFKQKRVIMDQKKKDEIKWRILVRKIIRTKSITGAPFFQYV